MKLYSLPLQLIEALKDSKIQIDHDHQTFIKQLKEEQALFLMDCDKYNEEINSFSEFGLSRSIEMEQYAALVETLHDKLEHTSKLVQTFQYREQIFGLVTENNQNNQQQNISLQQLKLNEIQKKFKPYFQLWSTTQAFNSSYAQWTNGPFLELNADQILQKITIWSKLMYKLQKDFKDYEKPYNVAYEMRKTMNNFQKYIPIIGYLCSPGLQQRHWEAITEIIEPNFIDDDEIINPNDITLQILLDNPKDILQNITTIEEIAIGAQKEYTLETTFDAMRKEWRDIKMNIVAHKNTETYILKDSEDILAILDEQLVKTQSMRSSPYCKPIEKKAKSWDDRLQGMSYLMDEWLTCQKTWIYLEPIFSSDDINRQMPKEGKRFKSVDGYWRKTMNNAKNNLNFFDFFTETDRLLETFIECNKMLTIIGKKLSAYLDSKRMAFPRFFFLSNLELLSILSQTKNPLAVQPHLNKCFDAIQSLHFNKKGIIDAMISSDGEIVSLYPTIDPYHGPRAGNVEIWLKDVESSMKISLHRYTRKALLSYNNIDKTKWVLEYPSQIILAVNQIMWTNETEHALRNNNMIEYEEKFKSNMMKLVELVRGNITKLQRKTLEPLMVLEVHSRDVISNLIKNKHTSIDDFEWSAQMRYYWDTTQLQNLRHEKKNDLFIDGNLQVRMINTYQNFGWEYAGNSNRLVITPLTDRCYRTLMGAIQLNLGGAPEGPAGTGKTETVKDLAKALAIQCIVINCSEAITYKGMAKFFKGLASSGAWACFDEFNRIELEVLSVVAQQISTIQSAIQAGKHSVFFDDVTIPVIDTCSVFITMNPSEGGAYAGRAELPDNLKALFRTVAMMIPNYAMIAEISLFSFGFEQATSLSGKIVRCLRLSSEQLSSQHHYDFGMRNVKSVLNACGKLKRKYPNKNEELLCLQAIIDCNEPKFLSQDIPLFQGICKDLFPSISLTRSEDKKLLNAIKKQLKLNNLQFTSHIYEKILQLYDTLINRWGLMIVGQTDSAKSVIIKILAYALKQLYHDEDKIDNENIYGNVHVDYLNPKAITLRELYGYDDPNTHEWTDGILPEIMRTACEDHERTKGWKWIIFDGPVDALWIENMNTVLDDNRKLCLSSGEQIKMVSNMNMMFETDNLDVASPATVSRCGMVYMEPKSLGYQPIFQSWLNSLPSCYSNLYLDTIKQLDQNLISICINYIFDSCQQILIISDIQMIRSLTRIFNCFLDEFYQIQQDIDELESNKQHIINQFEIKKKKRRKKKKTNEKKNKKDTTKDNTDDDTDDTDDDDDTEEEEEDTDDELTEYDLTKHQKEITNINNKIHNLIDKSKNIPNFTIPCFIYSIIWSIGSCLNSNSIELFSNFLTDLLIKQYKEYQIPIIKNKTTVYDYIYQEQKWIYLMDNKSNYIIDNHLTFDQIIVPTIETERLKYNLKLLTSKNVNILLSGTTGTGKTMSILNLLNQQLSTDLYETLMLHFNARTTAAETQDLIDDKLERRRAGVLGPTLGKRCVIYIDDLNMPAPEEFGAQPAIELLRQWMDYHGWYNRKSNTFQQLVDIQFIASMGSPGSGRKDVTNRYLRHFNIFCTNPYTNHSLYNIYNSITNWWLYNFNDTIKDFGSSIVKASIQLYSSICNNLLPTPTKSHYMFNLRDLSVLYQGMIKIDALSMNNINQFIKLWAHESSRVFCDRLINEKDINIFYNLLTNSIKENFGSEYINDNIATIMFTDYIKGSNTIKYEEINDINELTRVTQEYLDEYNTFAKTSMNLVLFKDVIYHLTRLIRILRQPNGHALLIGIAGSGRHSICRLATFIANYELYEIEITTTYTINDWHNDLIDLMKKCGLDNQKMVFLMDDGQFQSEIYLEDINSLLNTGEIPHLYPNEIMDEIIDTISTDAIKAGYKSNPFDYFKYRIKQNLHIVLAMSPIGDKLRLKLRTFPSLVNCATFDWYHTWPTNALYQVANQFLKNIDVTKDILKIIVTICVDMQQRVINLSNQYYLQYKRRNYITPSSFLKLITIFNNLFNQYRGKILKDKQKYEVGLSKLNNTSVQVAHMQDEINELQPKLIISTKETEELMNTISKKTTEINATRELVSQEEIACTNRANLAKKLKDECSLQLKKAMPALNQATKALKSVTRGNIDELRLTKAPTAGVLLTMEAMCIMFNVKVKKIGKVGHKKLDYWGAAKKELLGNPKFLQKIYKYDRDHIDIKIINKIKKYIQDPEFKPEKVLHSSIAAEAMCKWVIAIAKYYTVYQEVKPKKEKLKQAEIDLKRYYKELKDKKDELQSVENILSNLKIDFQTAYNKKQKLEHKMNQCTNRLNIAEQLINGLSNEKNRWINKIKKLTNDLSHVVGDILLASGIITYLGYFPIDYRQQCITQWIKLLEKNQIKVTIPYNLATILGNEIQIQQWHVQHLPKDLFSINNAIIIQYHYQWPLIIDPQDQANQWIKQSHVNLSILKQNDDHFLINLSNCIQKGVAVLIENIGDNIDSILDPLLAKETFITDQGLSIRLANEIIPYHPNFQLYLTSKLSNPLLTPEIMNKTNVISFVATAQGLQDQMLSVVVNKEHYELEQRRNQLIIDHANNLNELSTIELQILSHLEQSKVAILDDEDLVQSLQHSKNASITIENKMKKSLETTKAINHTRIQYQSLAYDISHLFFTISNLYVLDPMYQYSLLWYINLFKKAIDVAESDVNLIQRAKNIKQTFLLLLYQNICRSLFEKDKLTFSFLLYLKIKQIHDEIDVNELQFFYK